MGNPRALENTYALYVELMAMIDAQRVTIQALEEQLRVARESSARDSGELRALREMLCSPLWRHAQFDRA
jgi:hypothetical protein